jgi:hypothetical protein
MIGGMAEKTLKEKIGWKPGQQVLAIGLPAGVDDPFAGVDHTSLAAGKSAPKRKFDLLLGFAADRAALKTVASAILAAATDDSKLWVCYPKGSSGMKSDLTRDVGWEPLFDAGWIVVAIASVDATWSAVRFRPKRLVKSVRC